MTVINTNINALSAQNALTINSRNLSGAMQQLSTGVRINSAKDDAAGLAIANTMTSQIRGLNMAVKNGNDAISLLQTAVGAIAEQVALLQRMRELAVQAASDSVSNTGKGYLNTEFAALQTQIDQIASSTQWNGANILDGTGGEGNGDGFYAFQVGSTSGVTIFTTIPDMSTESTMYSLGYEPDSDGNYTIPRDYGSLISTAESANTLISAVDLSIADVEYWRSEITSAMNQLTYAVDNITNVAQNLTEGRSRILDTDYAQVSAQLAKSQIIQQAATAMLAQANQQQQTVLALLK